MSGTGWGSPFTLLSSENTNVSPGEPRRAAAEAPRRTKARPFRVLHDNRTAPSLLAATPSSILCWLEHRLRLSLAAASTGRQRCLLNFMLLLLTTNAVPSCGKHAARAASVSRLVESRLIASCVGQHASAARRTAVCVACVCMYRQAVGRHCFEKKKQVVCAYRSFLLDVSFAGACLLGGACRCLLIYLYF